MISGIWAQTLCAGTAKRPGCTKSPLGAGISRSGAGTADSRIFTGLIWNIWQEVKNSSLIHLVIHQELLKLPDISGELIIYSPLISSPLICSYSSEKKYAHRKRSTLPVRDLTDPDTHSVFRLESSCKSTFERVFVMLQPFCGG